MLPSHSCPPGWLFPNSQKTQDTRDHCSSLFLALSFWIHSLLAFSPWFSSTQVTKSHPMTCRPCVIWPLQTLLASSLGAKLHQPCQASHLAFLVLDGREGDGRQMKISAPLLRTTMVNKTARTSTYSSRFLVYVFKVRCEINTPLYTFLHLMCSE